jgi:glyoxylase-like metal-dependent hydrolase (beta-lactamase superfamily II)
MPTNIDEDLQTGACAIIRGLPIIAARIGHRHWSNMPALRLLLVVIGTMLSIVATAHDQTLTPVRIADSVYAFIGSSGEIDTTNRGEVGNSGFIVARDGVIVVDTGASARHGQAIIDAIRQVTQRPISLVIITHAEQEFLFGAVAFERLGVPLLTHARSAELMRQRCEHCLQNLIKVLGADAMAGTQLVVPTRTVATSSTLVIGGRRIELLHLGWGSTPGDLIVYDPDSGVLFAGGLVSNRRIPQLRDGRMADWRRALERMEAVGARTIVPGYGDPGGVELIADTARYLNALDGKVSALYRAGRSLLDAVDSADLPEFSGWAMYPSLHRQNALHRYLQLELDELGAE